MIEVGILKNFNSTTYKAGVQLAGSLTTYFDDISVAKNIPSAAMVVGNYVIVAIPGGNPKDACVIATWPGGTPGGGMEVHGNEYHDPAFATEADFDAHASDHELGGDKEISLHGLQGAPFDVLPLYKRCMDEWWKTMDGWTQSTAGSGFDTNQTMRLQMETGATVNSRDSRYSGPCRGGPHINGQRGIIELWLGTSPSDWEFRFYIVHENESPAPLSDTEEHGGFKIINGDIYASVADGTSETAEDTGVDFSQSATRTLEIRGKDSNAVEFYVSGQLVKTIDTNIPQNWGYRIVLEIKNTAAANRMVRVSFFRHTDNMI
jgi:hypothetical protein